jgi:hypothetical protein
MAINAGQGTILKFAVSGTLTALAQVVEVDGPDATVGTKETTNLSSVAKTYRATLPDGGTVTATIQYDPADTTHENLTAMINTWPQAAASGSVTFNTASGSHGAAFSCILTRFHPKGMNQEDNLEADIEFKITGVVTWS